MWPAIGILSSSTGKRKPRGHRSCCCNGPVTPQRQHAFYRLAPRCRLCSALAMPRVHHVVWAVENRLLPHRGPRERPHLLTLQAPVARPTATEFIPERAALRRASFTWPVIPIAAFLHGEHCTRLYVGCRPQIRVNTAFLNDGSAMLRRRIPSLWRRFSKQRVPEGLSAC